jgi:hypothetical protein
MAARRTLIILLFHLWPFKQATVASMSSMSPWRQFFPSIFEIDAMFPAPKASAPAGSSTSIAIAMSNTYCEETPMVAVLRMKMPERQRYSEAEKKAARDYLRQLARQARTRKAAATMTCATCSWALTATAAPHLPIRAWKWRGKSPAFLSKPCSP